MFAQKKKEKQDLLNKTIAVKDEPNFTGASEDIQSFIAKFYAHVSLNELQNFTPNQLFALASSIRSFLSTRKPGEPKVRVYNPRIEDSGWISTHTVIEIINDDMPFLVDSITAELGRLDLSGHHFIHPTFSIERDAEGQLININYDADQQPSQAVESVIHIQINEQSSPETHKHIRHAILKVLGDIRVAVKDWQPIRKQLHAVTKDLASIREKPKLNKLVKQADINEITAFLEWLDDAHFTFLGYRKCKYVKQGNTTAVQFANGLGVLRDENTPLYNNMRNFDAIPRDVQEFLKRPDPLLISKSNKRSTVHRATHMDVISIKSYDEKGTVIGEHRFAGLFTSTVYFTSPQNIPLLRRKLTKALTRAQFKPTSHAGKALVHILSTFPRDELFQISDEDLYHISMGILELKNTQNIALFARMDPFERFASCFVYVPRDIYSTSLRVKIQEILEKSFDGEVTAYYTQLSDEALARLHLIIKTEPGKIPNVDYKHLEAQLVEAGHTWHDFFKESLIESRGEEKGLEHFSLFGRAFPSAYRETFSPGIAVSDIQYIEDSIHDNNLKINLYQQRMSDEKNLSLKLFNTSEFIPLSTVLPMLEQMGMRVITEIPFKIRIPAKQATVWIHYFTLETTNAIDIGIIKANFEECFLKLWAKEIENDNLNQLVSHTNLNWRDIVVIRAYCRYLRQAQVLFSQEYLGEVLIKNAPIAELLCNLFKVFFDPHNRTNELDVAQKIINEIHEKLEDVAILDEDRILRRILNLIQATIRTNHFQKNEDGKLKNYLSIKFNSQKIDELPLPRPLYEIFTYSPYMEAIHLRGGKVARGGIRWSDRREDFRTEVLGLMKAQMVKNSVIIPIGSKGGFVAKQLPENGDRDETMQEVVRCYKTMISGMLDLTDNLVDGHIVPPKQVVRRDQDDPYLVVAADKGTATFSDIANGVAREYKFWLDDGFASGGSKGYDHKKMGITARGAWESVKRHFREKGINTQTTEFTVVGIGDMAGDVFGNGMLLSEHINLVGAFNHMHIFIDPHPVAKTSFKERQRLFKLPRSAWTDYNTDLISKGGGIYNRAAKSIKLTDEIKELFDIEADEVTPNELVRYMLKASIDLLWFGGIGTYVKAEDESHADVGDRANDRLRVNASELRCHVIGEGANLGITQRARIEFALCGGSSNTDAIDNSAGVDCSDHEVNIKILFGQLLASKTFTMAERDTMLEEMTQEVGELVLVDNYLQTQAISLEEMGSIKRLNDHVRLIQNLEKERRLDRALEALPSDKALNERRATGRGLTRPELAVILAYSKISLYEDLLASNLPDDPDLQKLLLGYFPQLIQEKFAEHLSEHRLKREIVATVCANNIINRVGCTFVNEMKLKTNSSTGTIAQAYIIVKNAYELDDLWYEIESLDNKISTKSQMKMLREINKLISRTSLWLLQNGKAILHIESDGSFFLDATRQLSKNLKSILDRDEIDAINQSVKYYTNLKVSKKLAERIAQMSFLSASFDIARIAHSVNSTIPKVARAYFTIGKFFEFNWLRETISSIDAQTIWQKTAISSLTDELYSFQHELTEQILKTRSHAMETDPVGIWTAANYSQVRRTLQIITDLKATPAVDLAMFVVATNHIKELIAITSKKRKNPNKSKDPNGSLKLAAS